VTYKRASEPCRLPACLYLFVCHLLYRMSVKQKLNFTADEVEVTINCVEKYYKVPFGKCNYNNDSKCPTEILTFQLHDLINGYVNSFFFQKLT